MIMTLNSLSSSLLINFVHLFKNRRTKSCNMMKVSFGLKCCGNIFQGRQRKLFINFALFVFLSVHLVWHLSRVYPLCRFDLKRIIRMSYSADVIEEACRNASQKPVVGCMTNTRKPIYKDDVRVLGNRLNNKVFLTLGIPTIQRKQNNKTWSYLEGTLNSLIENLAPDQMNQIHIVIFLADLDEEARQEKRKTISSKFQKYIDNNLISVVQAPREFYPPLRGLPRTYGDPPDQVFWRSKQNMDYSFLFSYCEDLSEYYMQMEDDVTTVKNYLGIIKDCIRKHGTTKWTYIQIVTWGFVGKIFRNTELDYFSRILRMFYNDKPCDWLILDFNHWRGFNSSSGNPPCGNVFFHKGQRSSLSRVQRPFT